MGRPACTEPQCLYKGALYLFFLNEVNFIIIINPLFVTICPETFSNLCVDSVRDI
jgi:hypothetical protein